MAAQPAIWSYVRLLLCVASAYLMALLFSDGALDPVGVWVTCLGNWLAVWLFCELRPLRAEQYSWRMLLGVFKYGPLALFLFGISVALLPELLATLSAYIFTGAGAVYAACR